MQFERDGENYEILYGSDIVQDGVFLELNEAGADRGETLLYAFWSYQTRITTFRAFRPELPFALVETFVAEVRHRLPPDGFVPPDEAETSDDP
jgi:hypothetical protein